MFGDVPLPFDYNRNGNHIKIRAFKGGIRYQRISGKTKVLKRLYGKNVEIRFSPVKPFNCPKMVTSHLMIEFGNSLIIPPKKSQKVFLKFPVEIGVIVSYKGKDQVIDVFTNNPPKYALFGDIKDGILCRYYKSDIYLKPPKSDSDIEGIFEIKFKNNTATWKEISELIFQGTLMKIFYSKEQVSGKVNADIMDDENTKIKFHKKPFDEGQFEAYEILTVKTYKVLRTRFTVEGGY